MRGPHFLAQALDNPGGFSLCVVGSSRTLATYAELAANSAARRRGLLGRDELPAGHALILAPTQGIHTFGMRFAIDVVSVSRMGVVVDIRRRVPRRRVVISWRAFAMIELPAGAAESVGIAVGDRLAVHSPSIRVS